ncbi:MAG: hypothetical protein HY917_04245 [Candidatus Diapherotrites archaeon]|nr:hypothetical protein [Candidatus Diapherotrites archaeon]
MSFLIKSSKRIEKEVQELDDKLRQKLTILLLDLKETPVPVQFYDVAKISGQASRYRIRIGNIRIIYDIEWKEKTIELFKVEKRKDRTYKF